MAEELEFPALEEMIDNFREAMRTAINDAYMHGLTVGGERMRSKIMLAAGSNAAMPERAPSAQRVLDFNSAAIQTELAGQRAPRGSVGTAIQEILSANGKMKIFEIEDLARKTHPNVATKSLGNQLRRLEGKLYVRDSQDRWFLLQK